MGLRKGMTNNENGRPKGSKNRVTLELRERINNFLSDNWTKLQLDFDKLEPKDRVNFYEKLLQYGLPKMQHRQLSSDYKTSKADLSKIFPNEEELKR